MKLLEYGRIHAKKRILLLSFLLLLALNVLGAFNLSIPEASAVVSPYIGVVPKSTVNQDLTPGMNYTVSIFTDYDGNDTWGYDFKLSFNPSVLEGLEVVNGDLITEDDGPPMWHAGSFNNTAGKLSLTFNGFFFFNPPPPLTSGPGILANITFRVISVGNSDITLETNPDDPERTKLIGYYYNTTLEAWKMFYIIDSGTTPEQIQHGFFSNSPDIAVTDVTTSVIEAKPGTIVDVDVVVLNNGTSGESFNVTVYYDSTEINTTLVSLGAGENTTLNVSWDTTAMAEGNYTIRAYAWPLPGEVDTTDNTYIDGEVRITSIVHDVAVTNVEASSNTVLAGDAVNITVTVKNKGTEIESFDVAAKYNNSTIATQNVTNLAPDAEETLTFLWNTTGARGNYTIAAIASLPGEANLADNTFYGGEVRVALHDVAVTSITVSPTTAEIGENITITVIVQNQGTESETFEVKAYRNATEIGTRNVIDLNPDAERTLTFTWDTTGLDAGDYTIKAIADTVAGETDEADNTKTFGTFTLSSPAAAWPPMDLVIAGVLLAIVILALGTYLILRRRKSPKA